MTISLYEKFTGVDWQRMANSGGMGAVVLCLVGGVLEVFVGSGFSKGISLVVVGIAISTWEAPFIFACIPPCGGVIERAHSIFRLHYPATRAFIYLLLAILFFHGPVLLILIGIFFLVISILNAFAHVNLLSDLADGTVQSASESGLLEASDHSRNPGFGTF